MIKAGTNFECIVDTCGMTKDGRFVNIYKGDIVTKVKNTFSDIIHLRDMYMLRGSGVLLDIPMYAMSNKFKEI